MLAKRQYYYYNLYCSKLRPAQTTYAETLLRPALDIALGKVFLIVLQRTAPSCFHSRLQVGSLN